MRVAVCGVVLLAEGGGVRVESSGRNLKGFLASNNN
jgi:hypothetical protein